VLRNQKSCPPAQNPPNLFGADGHPAEECWAAMDRCRMRYLRAGSGPALVMVHGLLGYSFSWRFATPMLSRQATVYAVDMPGAGFSDRCAGLPADLRASAQRMLRFLDIAGIASCDLLGSSRGGAVAMMAAALAPERVRSLILVSPVNPWSSHGQRISKVLSHSFLSGLVAQSLPALTILHPLILKRLFGDTRRILPGTLEGYAAATKIPGTSAHAIAILRTWNGDLEDLQAMLPRIAGIPALLLWGSMDRAVDPQSARELQKLFHDCRLITFEGAGHMPYEEVPEEFNRAVSEFLLRRRSAPASALPLIPSNQP
jgi:pimeloyl-ACP methyl ester carboxylesterase